MKRTPFAIGVVAFIIGASCAAVFAFLAPAISPGADGAGAAVRKDHIVPAVSVGIGRTVREISGGAPAAASLGIGRAISEIGGGAPAAANLGIGSAVRENSSAPVWTAIKWPFLLDQWGTGKAWACSAADCGVRIEVYVRPKIGFCNCTTGVSDEAELERVADTDLVSETVKPAGPAAPVMVRWMKGLSRAYQVSAQKPDERLISVAFNNECDVVVALAAIGKADPAAVTPAVVDFLNAPSVMEYVQEVLGIDTGHSHG